MLINIHTHKLEGIREWAIKNLYEDFNKIPKEGVFSMGLHPWYISPNWPREFDELAKYAKDKKVVAIGECGLDKICDVELALQHEVFTKQVELASHLKKPLIIHCVRAFEEILHILKYSKSKVPVIFHGFNKSISLAKKIIDQGHWLSFGKALQHADVQNTIAALPIEKIFLETDDAPISITEVYNLAASALKIERNLLSFQIQKNAATVFNRNFFNL